MHLPVLYLLSFSFSYIFFLSEERLRCTTRLPKASTSLQRRLAAQIAPRVQIALPHSPHQITSFTRSAQKFHAKSGALSSNLRLVNGGCVGTLRIRFCAQKPGVSDPRWRSSSPCCTTTTPHHHERSLRSFPILFLDPRNVRAFTPNSVFRRRSPATRRNKHAVFAEVEFREDLVRIVQFRQRPK